VVAGVRLRSLRDARHVLGLAVSAGTRAVWRSRTVATAILVVPATCLCACGGLPSITLARHTATPAGPTTYYLSPSGHDTAAGTSPATAWRSLARASVAVLRPGQRLLLKGGARFTGQLKLGPKDGGNPRNPVRIGSYGTGRAAILASGESGLVLNDTAGFDISRLVITGRAAMRADTSGILLFSSLAGKPRLDHVTISNVDVSGFGTGISIDPQHDTGFRDVTVSRSRLHGNLDAGLASYGPAFNSAAPYYANVNINILRVTAYDNRGDPANTASNSGSGIFLGSVRNASIAWSTAYHNGGRGGAKREGPEGMWAYDATGVRIEHDLAYGNTSASAADGGGFELDANTTASVMEYSLSYGNHGPGFELFGSSGHGQSHNVIRFDISSGDGNSNTKVGSILVTGVTSHAAIYQNTVIVGAPARPTHAALMLGPLVEAVTVRNNIFAAMRPEPVVLALSRLHPAAARLQGNDYYAVPGHFAIAWGQAVYLTLSAWRAATGEERLGRRATGFLINPRLTGPVLGLRARTIAGAGAPFTLRPRSRLRGTGLPLQRLFGIHAGSINFSGQPISITAPNVGAQ
jgi:Right handed beta helix region